MDNASLDRARAAKSRAEAVFGKKAVVVGVGLTRLDGGYGLKVNLGEQPPRGVDFPEAIDGVPVHVEVVGAIRKI